MDEFSNTLPSFAEQCRKRAEGLNLLESSAPYDRWMDVARQAEALSSMIDHALNIEMRLLLEQRAVDREYEDGESWMRGAAE
jgi:hypothetical protein